MNTYHLNLPVTKEKIETLRAGDIVYLTGTIFTLRDRPHQRIHEYAQQKLSLPFDLKNGAVIHCGPIIKDIGERKWEIVSMGATSSSRFSPFVASLIKGYGPRIIIGKGNLFKEAVDALSAHRSVFLLAIGGCAALYASQVVKVVNCYWENFGMADSVWEFEVNQLGPLSVGIDCDGGNLYKVLRENTLKANLAQIYKECEIDPELEFTWWPKVAPGTKSATDYSTEAK